MPDGLKKGGVNVVFFDDTLAKGFRHSGCAPEENRLCHYGIRKWGGRIWSRHRGAENRLRGAGRVANVSLCLTSPESRRKHTVTKPKNYSRVTANKPVWMPSKPKQDLAAHSCGPPRRAAIVAGGSRTRSDESGEIAKYLKAPRSCRNGTAVVGLRKGQSERVWSSARV